MFQLKLRRVGKTLGFTLPVEVVRMLQLREGDAVYLTEGPDGFRLTPHDPAFEQSMRVAEGFMSRYKNALTTLAR